MSLDLLALKEEQPRAPTARQRRSLDLETQSVVRVLPIRWRLLSIAALNATVAIILAALIWNGANVLSRAWDDVRTVRESDKLLVLLESEASRLQNLIHRYINQPSQEVLTEILGLHGEVLSTLRNRGAVDPVLSGSADELRAVTERFLQGFGEVRALQTTAGNDGLGLFHIAFALFQGLAAVHDARASEVTQLLDERRGNVGHAYSVVVATAGVTGSPVSGEASGATYSSAGTSAAGYASAGYSSPGSAT